MKEDSAKAWTPGELHALIRGYQGAAVLAAAAELDLFSALEREPQTARALAERIRCDARGLAILLDAGVADQDAVERCRDYMAEFLGPRAVPIDADCVEYSLASVVEWARRSRGAS